MPTVSLEGSNQSFNINENETIFDALKAAGYELSHGCLAGSCGACRIEVTAGQDQLMAASFPEDSTIKNIALNHERIHGPGSAADKVFRLSCQAKVTGDITIKELT